MFISQEAFGYGVALINDTGSLLELSESHIDVQIDNQISIVTSTQVFNNKTGELIRIKYGFPLKVNSNPISLRWKINDGEWKEAIVNEDNQDTTLPNTTGGSGSGTVSASDLDRYLGENPLFFAPTDDVDRGDKLTIEIKYVELLAYDFGEVNFNYSNDYSIIQFNALDAQTFKVRLLSDRTILSHTLNVPDATTTSTDNELNISYESMFDRALSEILFSSVLSSEELGLTTLSTMVADTLFQCDSNGKGYISMIVEPESNDQVAIIKKNFTLVIDRSGSMSGSKIYQARSAASFIIKNLNRGDKFNIVDFSSSVKSLFPGHEPYNQVNEALALEYIDDISASGSTNISGSLQETIDQFDALDPDKANIIIFFTDGVATTGIKSTPEILDLVQDEINQKETGIFLFTFGIGNDVDQQLLSLLALQNNGIVAFLGNDELEPEITTFFLKINNPVLINTSVEMIPSDVIYEVYPSLSNIPNLYKGQQLILSARYDSARDVTMKLSGKAFNIDVTYELPLQLSDSIDINKSFLPRIWAKQKIDNIQLDYYSENNPSVKAELQEDIDALSTCYNVVSLGFNSFVDGAVLEIDLLDFYAQTTSDNDVELIWTTATEINNQKFIIQRSRDGRSWEDIGEVEGAGTDHQFNHYNYLDQLPYKGISYYRLKQIDYNGEFSYTIIVAVNIESGDIIEVYPNPIASHLDLNINTNGDEPIDILLFDTKGQMVSQNKLSGGRGKIKLPQLASGLYTCLINGNNITERVRIMIK